MSSYSKKLKTRIEQLIADLVQKALALQVVSVVPTCVCLQSEFIFPIL